MDPGRKLYGALVIGTLVLISLAPYLEAYGGWESHSGKLVVGLIFLLGVSWPLRQRQVFHLTLLCALMGGWAWSRIWPEFWPFKPLVPLAAYGAIVAATPDLRAGVGWLKAGRCDRVTGWLAGVTVIGSVAMLPAWYRLLDPQVSHFLEAIPDVGPAWLALAGLGFALLNAAVEEGVFRGVVMQATDAIFGRGVVSLLMQAAAFGAIHFIGFPNGWIGVGMATVYGIMLGLIRRSSGGMLLPFATHVIADLVIFAILVFWVG